MGEVVTVLVIAWATCTAAVIAIASAASIMVPM